MVRSSVHCVPLAQKNPHKELWWWWLSWQVSRSGAATSTNTFLLLETYKIEARGGVPLNAFFHNKFGPYSFGQLEIPLAPLAVFHPVLSWYAPRSICRTPYLPCSKAWCHARFYISLDCLASNFSSTSLVPAPYSISGYRDPKNLLWHLGGASWLITPSNCSLHRCISSSTVLSNTPVSFLTDRVTQLS